MPLSVVSFFAATAFWGSRRDYLYPDLYPCQWAVELPVDSGRLRFGPGLGLGS